MKRKNKVHITADLKTDLNKFSVEVSKALAKQVRYEMLETAQDAIVRFYADYTPVRYKRHYYNFLENSFRGYYKNPHNQIIRGGIELNPEFMDNIYDKKRTSESTEIVFNLVYAGYHGDITATGHGYEIPPMNPSPLDIINTKHRYIIENIKKYQNGAFLKASGESYKTLRF